MPHEGDDPFYGLFTGVEDAACSSDASDCFHGVQQAFNHAAAAYREACSRSRAELHRYEVDLRRVTEERNTLKLLLREKEELEAQLASELAKDEKTKADADAMVVVYRADAEVTQLHAREVANTARTRAHWITEFAKCQTQKETLEEIHAQGFDLSEEITKARELEADVGALASDDDDEDDDDDDYDDGSKSGSQSEEEPDGEKTAPRR
ncbi:uncharacterized protein [Nicotiana tomentosiformis]|uniref:uncharacterized protein n=1 Tax=Nicotiana tomentosiformis TaxID=4098 RepID=UPI00051B298F|nr:zinc finger CCCH domain-containing protein 15 homolog [Nicotiana tomentosiformis]